MCFYKLIRPLFFLLPAETAHNLTIKSLKLNLLPKAPLSQTDMLSQKIAGLTFKSPVGLAAGFDKNAETLPALCKMGFGFVEVGTVTPNPQAGNPKPRIFRCPAHKAVINRMGFPNKGLAFFKRNITAFRAQPQKQNGKVIGLNIGMNKDQTAPEKDYTQLTREIGQQADYLTINISSPNTPGLRNLQEREFLLPLIHAVQKERDELPNTPPLFIKLAPDLNNSQIKDISKTLLEAKIEGVILTNTTLARPNYLPEDFRAQAGGLSGAPVKDAATDIIGKFYSHLKGNIPIIGCGGISNAADAYEKIKAGAALLQIYSALIYEGPALPCRINTELASLLKKDGHAKIQDAIGTALANTSQQAA